MPPSGHGVAGVSGLSKELLWVILSLMPPPLRSAGPSPSLSDPLCAAGDWPCGPHGLGPLVLVTSVWLQLCEAWAGGGGERAASWPRPQTRLLLGPFCPPGSHQLL